jgi:hypothetical protein
VWSAAGPLKPVLRRGRIERYGTATEPWGPTAERSKTDTVSGVKVIYASTPTALLAGELAPDVVPVFDARVPAATDRCVPRLVMFVAQLLVVARPAQFAKWELFALPTLGGKDALGTLLYAIGITYPNGTKMLLL